MQAQPTKLVVRVISCDAKVIGTLVGGCRVTVKNLETGEVLARGVQLGGSGDTQAIMKDPHPRYGSVYGTGSSACFETASKTTWLIPGLHLDGEGLRLTLHGFMVDILEPDRATVFHSGNPVHLETCVKLL